MIKGRDVSHLKLFSTLSAVLYAGAQLLRERWAVISV